MRIAIIADVHANHVALERVLQHAEAGGALDAIWVLGDLVGYGPQPGEVIATLQERRALAVAGNHDLAACAKMGVEDFNDAAAAAALWTSRQLTPAQREYLAALPMVAQADGFTLVHGSLQHPEWEYLLTAEQALVQFELQPTPYSLVGHSHLPFWIEEHDDGPSLHPAEPALILEPGAARLIVNPGSAGQPRDGDPRVSYVLYDAGAATMTFHRVEYEVAAVQKLMEEAGLPVWLINRLAKGR